MLNQIPDVYEYQRDLEESLDALLQALDILWSNPVYVYQAGYLTRPLRLSLVYESEFDHPIFDYYYLMSYGFIPKALCTEDETAIIVHFPVHIDMNRVRTLFPQPVTDLLSYPGLVKFLDSVYKNVSKRDIKFDGEYLLSKKNVGSYLRPKYESYYDIESMRRPAGRWRVYYDPNTGETIKREKVG